MVASINHKLGQYNAELFEDLMFLLLQCEYHDATVTRNFVIPRSPSAKHRHPESIDFLVRWSTGEGILLEAKLPYTDEIAFGISKRLKELKNLYLPRDLNIVKVVLAVGANLPPELQHGVANTRIFFKRFNVEFELWDATRINELLFKYFHLRPASFSADALAQVVTLARDIVDQRVSSGAFPSTAPEDVKHEVPQPITVTEGERNNVIALVADFCSYSKFVHGSFGERELIVSVMGRFYRETRRIVASAGAYLDKYAGDGLLAFWFTDGAVPAEVIASSINECVYQLIGTSLAIAKEWQDRINLAVRPTGMRVGADVGPVLFISEQLDSNPPFHAIGESINLATRLQAAAKPNTLVVSNRLKGAFFTSDATFDKLSRPVRAKNIGKVMAWQKNYETEDSSRRPLVGAPGSVDSASDPPSTQN